MIRVGYIFNNAEIIGGGEISFIDLVCTIREFGVEPFVFVPGQGEVNERIKSAGIKIHEVSFPRLRLLSLLKLLGRRAELAGLFKKLELDIVHTNGSRCMVYAGLAAKYVGIPCVWHVRIADCDKLLDRFLAGLSTKIIAISKAVKKRFDWLKDNEKKVIIIYNGIDLERFNPEINGEEIRKEFQLSLEGFIVGIVGRLDWYKGHKYFLQAAKIVTETMPDVSFLIVGDGEYRTRLEDQVKQLHLDKNVIFTGNRNDIPEILSSINLFVLSSVSEGFGRVAAEASACMNPVVATNVGGITEVVKDGVSGRLVPSKNPTALAEAIIDLLKDRNKSRKMGLAGRKRVEELFSIDRNVRSIKKLYEDVLEIAN